MTERELKINVDNSTKELVIREGKAHPVNEPVRVHLNGTIDAPSSFASIRGDIDKQKAIVSFSYDEMYINLATDPSNELAPNINGKLIMNPALTAFGINAQKTYGTKELVQLLKMNRIHFDDKEQCMSLIANLNKFKASAQTEIEKNNDDRGNKKNLTEITVKTDLPLDFTLRMPIFKGMPDVKFLVEVCYDIRDASISLWLESVELQELIVNNRRELIDNELKDFMGYVIIQR